jgi:phosphonate transport system permease protein
MLTVPLTALAGAVYLGLGGLGLSWLYEFTNPTNYLWIPAGVGAALGAVWAILANPEQPVPIGTTVYYIIRTILNALRSIEPLIMVIVFVVWVSLGPFAGTLALALHTIAALGKLYSEQVESIMHGPLEAVQATGANRLQTVMYAVIPQVIPPFISFTMYRWDINVRMSTIIGFAGGGGIGFLLQKNINLLQYRAAAVQMLAIAVVVASMDYLSAYLREKAI